MQMYMYVYMSVYVYMFMYMHMRFSVQDMLQLVDSSRLFFACHEITKAPRDGASFITSQSELGYRGGGVRRGGGGGLNRVYLEAGIRVLLWSYTLRRTLAS